MSNSLNSSFLVYYPVDMAPFEICTNLKEAIKIAHEICDCWNLKEMEIYTIKQINKFKSHTQNRKLNT